jgi:hypothetical protein
MLRHVGTSDIRVNDFWLDDPPPPRPPPRHWRLFGVDVVTGQFWFVFILPLWLLAVAALPASVVWLVARHRRIRRMAKDHCSRCGYDLRGLSTARCPECGRERPGPIGSVAIH